MLLALLLALQGMVWAQEPTLKTGIQGRVVDAQTGEGIPFVQVGFVGTSIGDRSDMDGYFKLVSENGDSVVRFQMMGYDPKEMTLEVGVMKNKVKVELTAQQHMMGTVVVTAKRGKTRYKRHNNPAIELVEITIDNKKKMRPEHHDRYRRDVYEKFIMSLDDFHPDFENKKLWRKVDFLEKYIDRAPFDNSEILPISMRETMQQQSFRRKPKQMRTLTTARRVEGLEDMLGKEGIGEELTAMFAPIDIFDNDIELMMNHFVSPLSSTLATTFYKYYITDTTELNGQRCVVLSFVPTTKESYGFTGQLYIALDSNRSLMHYEMTVSPHVNLNFVRDLTVVQDYKLADDGTCIPTRNDTYARFYVHKKLQEIYAQQTRVYTNYDFSPDCELLPDSLFSPLSNTAEVRGMKRMRRKVWNEQRPIQLTAKETLIDSLRYELGRLPEFRAVKTVSEMLVGGYVATSSTRNESYFDVGPILNFMSYNHQEGFRLRLGGQTTAVLSDRNYADGYIAYGFGDKRLKYSLTYIHTFNDKRHHYLESPRSYMSLGASYDLETPGQNFDNFDRDNLLMSSDRLRKVQYVKQATLRVRKEWPSHINIDTWITAREVEPAGSLVYHRLLENGTTEQVSSFWQSEWCGKMTFKPNQPSGNHRNKGSLMKLNSSAPTVSLSHRVGYMDGGFLYQRTDLSAQKNFWLSSFGYIDTKVESGVVWNQAPLPLLYTPSANTSFMLSSSAFNTMKPMEFVMDQYVSLYATYHMKGLILRHIPLVRRLKLREVVGFNMLYGGLSPKNDVTGAMEDPSIAPQWAGLYTMPRGTGLLGKTPYMECSVGIENIFKFIRIDYVWRLSYLDGLPKNERGFLRVEFRFTI